MDLVMGQQRNTLRNCLKKPGLKQNHMKTSGTSTPLEKAYIYHLRGGIDYSILGFKHKTMMSMLYKKIKSMPEEEKNAEIQAMIETYDKQVDFVDFSSLEPIIQEVMIYC